MNALQNTYRAIKDKITSNVSGETGSVLKDVGKHLAWIAYGGIMGYIPYRITNRNSFKDLHPEIKKLYLYGMVTLNFLFGNLASSDLVSKNYTPVEIKENSMEVTCLPPRNTKGALAQIVASYVSPATYLGVNLGLKLVEIIPFADNDYVCSITYRDNNQMKYAYFKIPKDFVEIKDGTKIREDAEQNIKAIAKAYLK